MKLPLKVRIYIFSIVLLAYAAGSLVVFQNTGHSFSWEYMMFWSVLAILTESLVIRLPNGMGLSVGLAITLAALLSHGPVTAMLATGFGFMFRIIHVKETGKVVHILNNDPYKTLFNTAQGILCISISGIFFSLLGGVPGKFDLLLTIMSVVFYTVINSCIMALFFTFLTEGQFISTWIQNLKGLFFNIILVGSMGIILFLAFDSYGAGAVLLFIAPLLLARFAFKQYTDLRETYVDTIKAFNELTEAKDPYTGEHSSRVELYAVGFAKYLKLTNQQIENIRMAAILHDVGKIGIEDDILKKDSGLTGNEYKQIKNHPNIGADIIQNVHFLKDVSRIIRQHHERFDGKGYPENLSGDQICKEAVIVSLADTYDAITSLRAYNKPLSCEDAGAEIAKNAGVQFEPGLAAEFVEYVKQNPEVFKKDAV
ncbi:MAG: HD domain-containing protein [Eubacteriales bacterium]|nr:HD domain-containing protein [Eubacteriales bacterium]